jgi:hypothetical protein
MNLLPLKIIKLISSALAAFLLLAPLSSQAKIITRNLLLQAEQIKVDKNYSTVLKSGQLTVRRCPECAPMKLVLKPSSTLIVQGKIIPLQELLKTHLQFSKEEIRIQYYLDMSINYIEWGQDPKDKGAPL